MKINMTDAFIYDAIRSSRGKGRKDGAFPAALAVCQSPRHHGQGTGHRFPSLK